MPVSAASTDPCIAAIDGARTVKPTAWSCSPVDGVDPSTPTRDSGFCYSRSASESGSGLDEILFYPATGSGFDLVPAIAFPQNFDQGTLLQRRRNHLRMTAGG